MTFPPESGPRKVLVFGPQPEEETMARKRYRPEEIITKLREAEVLLAQGMKVPEVSKAIGIHEITYYRWRKEFGGMKVSQARRLKELEKENSRLRKAVSDLSLDKVILQEASRGNF
jgi:putative transposase